jgi:hypothetical protein
VLTNGGPQADRAWMDRLQCIVLGLLSFAEAGTLTVLELYYIHGTVGQLAPVLGLQMRQRLRAHTPYR